MASAALETFGTVLALFAVGRVVAFALARGGADVEWWADRLNQVAVGVCFPAVILLAAPSLSVSANVVALATAPWLLLALALAVAVVAIARGARRDNALGVALCVGFGNTAFLGYAVIPAVRGAAALPLAVVSDQLGSFLSLSTLGLVAISIAAGHERPSLKTVAWRLVKFPPFVALFIGVALMPTSLPLPLDSALKTLGALLLPTAAVAIGLRLRVPKGAAIWRPLGAVVGAKLVLMPAVAVAVCVGAGVTGDAAAVVVLQAAMPTMMTVGALLALAGVAVELSTAAVTVTTLVSMLTLPLWSGLVAALWP